MPTNPTGVLDLPIGEAELLAERMTTGRGTLAWSPDPSQSALERARRNAAVGMAAGFRHRASGEPVTLRLDRDGWSTIGADPSAERIVEYAGRLAGEWVRILDGGGAVGVSKVELAGNASDEVRDEHGRRVLSTAAAVPLAIEIAAIATGRPLQLVFPIDMGDGRPGYGVRYADEGGAA